MHRFCYCRPHGVTIVANNALRNTKHEKINAFHIFGTIANKCVKTLCNNSTAYGKQIFTRRRITKV